MTIKSVGKHTYGTNNVSIRKWSDNGKYVEIGNFCSIASVKIYLGGNHRIHHVTSYPFPEFISHNNPSCPFTNFDLKNIDFTNDCRGNVIIGNDVWIGDNVVIMSGITIGDGAVLAANSHITKNVEPYSIVGGNPAKIIRKRFTSDQISALLDIKWWDWPDEKINSYIPMLCQENIDVFIETVKNEK